MAARKSIVETLRAELRKAEGNVGKYISRPGIHYSWFGAAALDQGIQDKRDFAVQWRRHALDLAEHGVLTVRKVTVRWPTYSRHGFEGYGPARSYLVFSVHGVEAYAVYPSGSSNYPHRELGPEALRDGFESYIRSQADTPQGVLVR
jgi:hypothetical protein